MKKLSDYGTGMKDIIMNQLARERQAAWDKYNMATSAKDFHGMRVRHYNIKMQAVLLRLRIVDAGLHISTDQYHLGA